MSVISIDKSLWPPIMIYSFDGQQTEEDMKGLMASWQELVDAGEPFALITKLNNFHADFAHVKPVATWAKEHIPLLKQNGCGSAIVSPHSKAIQILLNAFLLIAPLPFPSKIFSTEDEALAWVKERLQEGPLGR